MQINHLPIAEPTPDALRLNLPIHPYVGCGLDISCHREPFQVALDFLQFVSEAEREENRDKVFKVLSAVDGNSFV